MTAVFNVSVALGLTVIADSAVIIKQVISRKRDILEMIAQALFCTTACSRSCDLFGNKFAETVVHVIVVGLPLLATIARETNWPTSLPSKSC